MQSFRRRIPLQAPTRSVARIALPSLLFLFFAGTLAAQWVNHDLESKRIAFHSLLIMPADASVARFGVKGGSPLPEASEQLSKLARAAVAQALTNCGCSVKAVVDPGPSAQPASAAAEQDRAVTSLQALFDQLHPKLRRHSGDVWKGRFTLGDVVLTLNPSAEADGLVFVRAQGLVKTRGETGFQLLLGNLGSAWDHLELQIAVADARAGTILFYGRYHSDGDILKDGEVSLIAAREALLNLECTPPGWQPKHKKPAKP